MGEADPPADREGAGAAAVPAPIPYNDRPMIDREDTPAGPVRRPRFGPGRRVLVVVLLALVALLLSLRGLANFWTDYLWFSSVGFAPVWSTLLVTKIVLAVIGIAAAFALLLGNLWLAQRVGPELAPPGPGEQLVLRYRSWAGSHRWWVLLGVSGFFGLILGLGAVGWWEDWLLFANRQSFGVTDPVFSRDIGFYVFQVPFLRDLFGWLFQFVVVTAVVVAAFYYLSGAIRVHPRGLRVAPGVKVHLSVLLAVLALLKAVGYWLDQFDLLYSERGAVFGAAYTDIHARLPAVRLLFFISLFAASAAAGQHPLPGLDRPRGRRGPVAGDLHRSGRHLAGRGAALLGAAR